MDGRGWCWKVLEFWKESGSAIIGSRIGDFGGQIIGRIMRCWKFWKVSGWSRLDIIGWCGHGMAARCALSHNSAEVRVISETGDLEEPQHAAIAKFRVPEAEVSGSIGNLDHVVWVRQIDTGDQTIVNWNIFMHVAADVCPSVLVFFEMAILDGTRRNHLALGISGGGVGIFRGELELELEFGNFWGRGWNLWGRGWNMFPSLEHVVASWCWSLETVGVAIFVLERVGTVSAYLEHVGHGSPAIND